MEFKRLYLGSWKPGSTIHLKEFYQAMAFDKSFYFEQKEIQAWKKGLKPTELHYNAEAINSVSGSFKNEIDFDVLEDGVLIISKEMIDLKKDREHLEQFMHTRFASFRDNIFSKDIKFPKEFLSEKVICPIVIHTAGATEKELQDLFTKMGAVAYKHFPLEKGSVWIGESMAVLNSKGIKDRDLLESIRYIMFARLYELELKFLLDVQRNLWGQTDSIRNRGYYKSSELPKVRDKALLIQSYADFFKSRTKQMNQFLSWRDKYVDDYLADHILKVIFKEFFLTLKSTQNYLNELWEMTANNANAAVHSVSLLYSDSQQKELRILQKLFLVSAVISVLSLGSLAGSNMITAGRSGELISKSVIMAWNWDSFVFYGAIVLAITLIIYILFHLVFVKLKHISRK